MAEAILGLVGVIVGAGLTFLQRLSFEVRRERQEAVIALGLVEADLRSARLSVETALGEERWPTGASKAWRATWWLYRPVLARGLRKGTDFERLNNAYGRMDELESGINAARADYALGQEGKDQEFLEAMEKLLEPAVEVFEKAPDRETLLR